jgi:hypothetical protein
VTDVKPLPLPHAREPSWTDDRRGYDLLAGRVEPVAVVTTKDSWGWTLLWSLGVAVTLGGLALGISLRRFLDDFATTFITRQGYPRTWPRLSNGVIVHEGRHTTQATWFGWLFFPIAWANRRLRAWLGTPGFALVYFVLPLPIGLAAGRFYLELDADRAAWRLGLAEGWMTPEEVRERARSRALTMSGGSYFWAWPRPWAKSTYRKAAEVVIRETER